MEIYGGKREKTVFHEYLQEHCFVLTEISEIVQKPPCSCIPASSLLLLQTFFAAGRPRSPAQTPMTRFSPAHHDHMIIIIIINIIIIYIYI